MTIAGTARVCFTLWVRPDQVDEYRRRHKAVWPQMLNQLATTGWKNYSLFLGDDGLLVGYLETQDFQAAREAMAASEVNHRWQTHMAPLFADADGRPDENMRVLSPVFHLETQLAETWTDHDGMTIR